MRIDRAFARVFLHVLILAIIVAWLVPSLGLFVTSFRETQAVSRTGWWTVFANPLQIDQYTLQNYAKVIFERGMGRAFFNSFLITVPAVVIPIVIASLAGFAFAWMKIPGKRWVFPAFVALLVVPAQMAFIPALRIFRSVGLAGTYVGVWLAHAAFALPLMVYLMHNFISEIPKDVIESAIIDGAGSFQVYARLIMPLAISAVASLLIFQFIWVWNDLLIALIFVGGATDVAPVTVRIASLVGLRGEGWEVLTAAAFVSLVVPLAIFFGLQRYFVKGLLAGSVKG